MKSNEKIIVSKELEGLIDENNVFGRDIKSGTIPLVIWIKNAIINTEVLSLKTTDNCAKIEFVTSAKLAQELLVHRDPDCIVIGNEDYDAVTIRNCKTKSMTVSAKDNMYVCKIVIDRNS